MSDVRVPMTVVLEAFGVEATVTRPFPDDTAIAATLAWVTPSMDVFPDELDLQRRTRRRVGALDRNVVPTVPVDTVIVAPERAGETAKTWVVETKEFADADHHRVVVRLREDD